MKVNHTILLFVFSLLIFFSFLIFRLNQVEVSLDILFKEIQVRLGALTLSVFLVGLITCLILEFIYFFKKSKD